MSLTIVLIVITCIISFAAFNNHGLMDKLLLWPAKMNEPVTYYRFLTAGFVHADTTHLAFNMITLYFFGDIINQYIGNELFILLYVLGIVVSCLPSFIKKRGDAGYRSLGASGGVAAIVFAMIYIAPWSKIGLFFLLYIPSILFAVLYLVYSVYMARKGTGYINHDAHLWGSVFGFLFMLLIDPSHGIFFIEKLLQPTF